MKTSWALLLLVVLLACTITIGVLADSIEEDVTADGGAAGDLTPQEAESAGLTEAAEEAAAVVPASDGAQQDDVAANVEASGPNAASNVSAEEQVQLNKEAAERAKVHTNPLEGEVMVTDSEFKYIESTTFISIQGSACQDRKGAHVRKLTYGKCDAGTYAVCVRDRFCQVEKFSCDPQEVAFTQTKLCDECINNQMLTKCNTKTPMIEACEPSVKEGPRPAQPAGCHLGMMHFSYVPCIAGEWRSFAAANCSGEITSVIRRPAGSSTCNMGEQVLCLSETDMAEREEEEG